MNYSKPLQEQQVARHLLTGKSLTDLQALDRFHVRRLAAIIWALRNEWGLPIKTKLIVRGQIRYASYSVSIEDKLKTRAGLRGLAQGGLAQGGPVPRAGRMRICGTGK